MLFSFFYKCFKKEKVELRVLAYIAVSEVEEVVEVHFFVVEVYQ